MNAQLAWHRARLRMRSDVKSLSDRAFLAFGDGAPADLQPTFVVIGAMKTATTSLHRILDEHPDVYMTYVKEPGLYLDDPQFMRQNPFVGTRERLHKLTFRGYKGEPIIGESTTEYSELPTNGAEAPARMAELAPHLKFVYMLRNPLDRIFSHYLHCLDLGIYDEPIDDILRRDGTFLERSLYAFQLSHYLKHFPRERFHLIVFEEFRKDSSEVINSIFRFLGLTPPPAPIQTTRQLNRSVSRNQFPSTQVLKPATYERLMAQIRTDVSSLETLMGRSLGLWDLSPERWCV